MEVQSLFASVWADKSSAESVGIPSHMILNSSHGIVGPPTSAHGVEMTTSVVLRCGESVVEFYLCGLAK